MLKKSIVSLLLVTIVAVVIFFAVLPGIADRKMNRVIEHKSYQISNEALLLHQTLFVADLHADPTLWGRDLLTRHDYGHMDIPRMRRGNHALQVFTTVTKSPSGLNYENNAADSRDNITLIAMSQRWPLKSWDNLTERALYQAAVLKDMERRAPDEFMVIESKSELNEFYRRRENGELIVAGIIGTEGSHALEGQLSNIQRLYEAGFRMMSLQHFFDNRIGGSLHGKKKGGLTTFGEEVVRKIDSMPILLDVSHSSEAVVEDVLAMVRHPLVISHTGIKGHCDSHRNISDDLMRRVAATGGVIGIGFWDAAVCDPSPDSIAEAIVTAVDLLGEDHVGLGSDFDGAVETAFDVSEMAVLTQALLNRNVPEAVIRKVMGENVRRVFLERLPDA